jgi:PAS domain S-box-containing protein
VSKRTKKFICWLLAFLIIFDTWLFIDLKIKPAVYVLLFFILLLLLVFILFLLEIKKLEKENTGLIHVLEKSEESRINAENLKSRILLVVDGMPEGLLVIDKDDKISVINSRAEKFLGVHRKQVLSKPILELGNLSNIKNIVLPLLVNFKAPHKEEIELRKNFILELAIEPLALGKNNIAKLIILHDITKIKQAEIAKNQFISVAAHQLKSPLSAARLSLKMLLNGDFGKINNEQKDILEKTYKKNESLIYLVEDLLKEAKTEEPDQSDNRSLVNLEDLVFPIADFYGDEMKRKKIDFKFNKPEGKLPEILADQEKIKMVIQNLFDNAVKYTPVKGRIEVDITPQKEQVQFEIKDSGMGIPENQKGKIFTRFSRAVNAAQKTPGSGLGLVIAKDIIEKHHGKIWFQSKENEGSTFFFTLPWAKK